MVIIAVCYAHGVLEHFVSIVMPSRRFNQYNRLRRRLCLGSLIKALLPKPHHQFSIYYGVLGVYPPSNIVRSQL